MAHKKMSWDDWVEQYVPMTNHIDNDASFNGFMYETYGNELQHVQLVHELNPEKIWTLVDGDRSVVVTNGFHFVNRVGYIITMKDADPKFDTYEIVDEM